MTNEIKNALAKGTKIGFLTWYDCRNASVTPSRLKHLFDTHGLSQDHFPDTIKPKNAFQKACRKAMVDTSDSSDNRRSITKLIVDGLDKIVYGIVDLHVHEKQESIDPDFSATVWLDKDKLTVSYDKPHELAKRVKNIYDDLCGTYTTRDISRMIVKALDKMASVSLRDAGVIYFIPAGYETSLLALQSVVNAIGECNMKVFTLGAGDGNDKDVHAAAKSQIADKIEGMKADIADLRESIEAGTVKGKTIENSIEVRRKRFNEVKMRCRVLADALKIKAETLEGDLDEVQQLIEKELEEFVSGAA